MKKDDSVYINDILESISKIEEYSAGKNESDFLEDTQLQDSITRRLEIIGEAAKGIPAETRSKSAKTPWKQIAGMRDVLIHAYAAVNIARIWKVVQDDLPALKKEMMKLKQDMKK